MKKLLVLLFASCSVAHLLGQEVEVASKLEAVDVYLSNAKETRTAQVTVSKGTTDVVISGVTVQLVDASLQIGVKGNATLLSATIRRNEFSNQDWGINATKAQALRDSIQSIMRRMAWIQQRQLLAEGEIAMLEQLLQQKGDKGEQLTPEDISAMADIYRMRFTDLRKEIYELTYDEELLNQRINGFNERIAAMAPKAKSPVKELVLSFSSETTTNIELNVSYLVNNAGWRPLYDIQVENTSSPVEMTYKAQVFQSTGIDWKDVKMKISTIKPVVNQNRPILRPTVVDFMQYKVQEHRLSNEISNSAYYVMQKDEAVNTQPESIVVDSELFVDFDLSGTHSVPGNGRQYVFRLSKHSIDAKYKYHAVPRLDNAAYLLAMVGDYGKYSFISGIANVFFGDNYVGQVNIQPAVTSDTLMISLGRDDRLIVQRTKVKAKCSKKVLSGTQKEVFMYEIVSRNNKNVAVELEIIDQIPISRRDNIKVELLEKSNADFHASSGTLKWTFLLNPSKSKTLTYGFELTYPENVQVSEQPLP